MVEQASVIDNEANRWYFDDETLKDMLKNQQALVCGIKFELKRRELMP